MAADPEKRILYDILVSLEWPTERQDLPNDDFPSLWKTVSYPLKGWWGAATKVVKFPFRGTSHIPSLVTSAIAMRIPWQFSLSHHGNSLAIVKGEVVEVWAISDDKDIMQLIGRCNIGKDPMPQWRKVCWSNSDTLLAVSSSSGEIFLLGGNGSLIAHLTDVGGGDDLWTACAGLMFVPAGNFGLETRMDVLITVTYGGLLNCYQIAGEFKILHTFNFAGIHPRGVGGVLYHTQSKILVVGGWGSPEGEAVSCWRMLDGAPYYTRAAGTSEGQRTTSRLFGFLSKRMDSGEGGIFQMALSPSGTMLAGIDGDGQLTLWDMPSGRMRKSWKIDNQHKLTESFVDSPQTRSEKGGVLPIDVNWWTEEAVIVAYSTGDVVVTDLEELNNHLGSNPESCEPGCLVSPAISGGFFVLECLSEVKPIPSAFTALATGETDKDSEDGPAQEGAVSRLLKQVLYYVTDAERFRPPQRAAKAAYHTYRLLALQSTTPEELYERKIRLEEYDAALDLAKVYGLDCDEVYKKQWERTPVSVETIRDYLSKVSNTYWLLKECILCVPRDYNTAKELLRYGLSKTDFSHLVDINNERENVMQSMEGGDHALEDNLTDIRRRIVSWGDLNEKQKFLCQHRLKLLQLLDRLSCYERILGGARHVNDRYSSEEFREFRDENLVQLAVQYARASDADSVAVLMTVFGDPVLPHWLAVLSNFPETTNPAVYEDILPDKSEEDIDPWEQESLRTPDWCEDPQIMAMFDVSLEELAQQNSGDFLYEERPEWASYRGSLNDEMLSVWFQKRAVEIELLSGQVDNALNLLDLGMDRGVADLEVVRHDFQTLYTLVYECNVDPTFSLSLLRTMSSLDKVKAMLRKVEAREFTRSFRDHVSPFLHRLNTLEPGLGGQVVEDYLLATAVDDLERCLDAFRILVKMDTLEKLTMGLSELMSLAVQCIYACERNDVVDVAFQIVECLPQRSDRDSPELQLIHDELDDLEDILDVARKLSQYDVKKTLQYIRKISSEPQQVEQLLTQFTRTAGRRYSHMSDEDWRDILFDLLHMQKVSFSCVEEQTCYEIFALTLLCSGSTEEIRLATQILTTPHSLPEATSAPAPNVKVSSFSFKLPMSSSASLVLKAVKEYINSATSYSDQEMELARLCLQLLGNSSKEAVVEMNLIKSLQLLSELGIEMLPVQVRMSEEKLDIIRELLTSKPKAYKQHKKVLELSRLLGLNTAEYEEESTISTGMGKTLVLLAEVGLEQNDVKAALGFCQEMIRAHFGGGWRICQSVAVDARAQDPAVSLSLLEFVSLHCPSEVLEDVLRSRNILEVQVLCDDTLADGRRGKVKELLGRSAETVEQIWSQGSGRVQHIMSYRPSLTGAVSLMKSATSYLPPLGYLKQEETSSQPFAQAQLHMEEKSPDVVNVEKVTSLQEKSGIELKPIMHPFYEDRGRAKSYLTGHYVDIDKGITTEQCLYRAHVLSHSEESPSVEEHVKVLMKLAEESFSRDISLSLCYLLALPDPLSTEELFDSTKATQFSLQFFLYYLSLVLNAIITVDTREQLPAPLFEDPGTVIRNFTKLVMSSDLSDHPGEVQTVLGLFKKYHRRLVDFEQAQTLLGLGLGIDVGRFAQDEDYKKLTILSLAQNVEEDLFSTSLSLAGQCGVEEWEVYVTHFKWLFCDSGLSVQVVRKRIEAVKMEEKLLIHPQQSVDVMENQVYPEVNGRDIPLLISFFTILKTCCDAGGSCREINLDHNTHLKLLKRFKTIGMSVDYKELMSGHDPFGVLGPALTDSNVHVLAGLAGKIPSGGDKQLSGSQVYKCFVEGLFWPGGSGISGGEEVDWDQRYETCHEYMARMDLCDVVDFAKSVTVSERALQISRSSRIGILQRCVKLAHRQVSSKEPTSEATEVQQESVRQLELCLKHLEMFERNKQELQMLPVSERFELSLCSPQTVESLVVEMVLDGLPLSDVEVVLRCSQSVQKHIQSVTKLTVAALLDALEKLSANEDNRTMLEAIERVCTSCAEDEGRHVSLERVTPVLLDFVQDSSKDLSVRLPVLAVIEQNFPSSSVESTLILFHRTKVLVEAHYEKEITSEDVESEQTRDKLFHCLLKECLSLNQVYALAEMLKYWPPSEATPQYWCSLIEAAIGFPEGDSCGLCLRAGVERLPVEEDRKLCNKMAASGGVVLSLKYALIADHKELVQEALVNVVTQDEQLVSHSSDGTLIELLILRGLCVELVGTSLYTSLQQHAPQPKCVDKKLMSLVLRCEENQVEDKLVLNDPKAHSKVVAKQLYDAGHWMEAGSIAMSGFPHFHSSLLTLNTAYDFMSKMFPKSRQ